MNTYSNSTAFGLAAMLGIALLAACSQKPSSEEIAAQVKIAMVQAEKDKQATVAQTSQGFVAPAPVESPAQKPVKKLKPKSAAHTVPPAGNSKLVCANCGMVLAVNVVEVEGKGSGAGVVAGGVVGGVVGNQMGSGTGRDLATFAGVLGGAIAGNKIEQKARKTRSYDIKVKMDDGSERSYHQVADPIMVKGQRVKIENDAVLKD